MSHCLAQSVHGNDSIYNKEKNLDMRQITFAAALLLSAMTASAKDIKTVVLTPTPQMHCENCENKVKTNLKFVKGVKSIKTSVEKQTITVEYDAEKTNVDKIQESLKKAKYTTTVQSKETDKKVDATTSATAIKK